MLMKHCQMKTKEKFTIKLVWQEMSKLRIHLEVKILSEAKDLVVLRDFKMHSENKEVEKVKVDSVTYFKNSRKCLVEVIIDAVINKFNKKAVISWLIWKLNLWKLLKELKKLFNSIELMFALHAMELKLNLELHLPAVVVVEDRVFKQLDKDHLWYSKFVEAVMVWVLL